MLAGWLAAAQNFVSSQVAAYIAAQNAHVEVLAELIEAKCAVDLACTDTGGTALFIAAQSSCSEAVRLLLDAKADPLKRVTYVGAVS